MQCFTSKTRELNIFLNRYKKDLAKFVCHIFKILQFITNLCLVLRFFSSVLWFFSTHFMKLVLQVPRNIPNLVMLMVIFETFLAIGLWNVTWNRLYSWITIFNCTVFGCSRRINVKLHLWCAISHQYFSNCVISYNNNK